MRILMVGGGSGGHVTPLKAVASKLKQKVPEANVEVVTDRKFYEEASYIFSDTPEVSVKRIFAGKLRRYNTKSFWWHIYHLPTLFKNIRDGFLISIGAVQALLHMVFKRPNIIFSKGGFVSVPVALAGHILRVPLVIHDSDTHPGLSNRITSRWAKAVATGMPLENYDYPKEMMTYTGIPVDEAYQPVSSEDQARLKQTLGFESDKPLVLVTGGGTGAQRLNETLDRVGGSFLAKGWQIAHLTGKNKNVPTLSVVEALGEGAKKNWQVHEFVAIRDYILAADVIITRAGASALQEFANAQKQVIVVPSVYLTGGHQVKNAQYLESLGAVRSISEEILADKPEVLVEAVDMLLQDKTFSMGKKLYETFANPGASETLADVILATIGKTE